MNRTRKVDAGVQDRRDIIESAEKGRITELTRGSALEYPWYEIGPPPFNHICPICDRPEP